MSFTLFFPFSSYTVNCVIFRHLPFIPQFAVIGFQSSTLWKLLLEVISYHLIASSSERVPCAASRLPCARLPTLCWCGDSTFFQSASLSVTTDALPHCSSVSEPPASDCCPLSLFHTFLLVVPLDSSLSLIASHSASLGYTFQVSPGKLVRYLGHSDVPDTPQLIKFQIKHQFPH